MANPHEPIWITGVGSATPLGHTFDAIADNLLAGRSGVRTVQRFDASQHPSQIAGQIETIPCPEGWLASEFQSLTRQEQLILWCCFAALRDGGFWEQREKLRIGLVVGIGAEWLIAWENEALPDGSPNPDADPNPESLVQIVRKKLRLSGPAMSLSAACASGNYALAQGRRWLELGWVDVCLAGACDIGPTPMSLAGFGNLRALSRRNAEPTRASRPFDKGRDGFVIGEGGAMFVLERAATARKRGANVYARIAGCGASSDAHHMVIPSTDPKPASMAMRQALADAGCNPGDIGYINAHATSTPVGDAAEARVLHEVLGEAVRTVPVSSTKSMTGHMLTGAAAVEAVACLAAIQRNAVPPTINLDEPDPECDLCHVPNQAREQKVRVAVSNSFGFGGSNTCLVLEAI